MRWGHTTELPDEVIGTAYLEGFRVESCPFDSTSTGRGCSRLAADWKEQCVMTARRPPQDRLGLSMSFMPCNEERFLNLRLHVDS